MVIRRIKLTQFRSHRTFVLECDPKTTKIIGENGSGKTSVLEAVYEVLQGKSFRAVDREILRRGDEFYRVELEYLDGRKIVVIYDGNKKEFLVEDKKTARLPKKVRYPIVLFEPDDLNLIGSSPTSRRNYFDRVFSQLSEKYSVALNRYNKALKQRNELLKQENVAPQDLFSWDVLLSKYGVELRDERANYIEKINERITDVYRSIAENTDNVAMEYVTEVGAESGFLAQLARNFERDRYVGHTGFGVHRDNYEFVFNGVKADGSASRGEVRSIVIALKFIEADMIVQKLNKSPVVLLDDVFSELDEVRQKCLVKNFQNNQIILTATGVQEDLDGCVVLKKDN